MTGSWKSLGVGSALLVLLTVSAYIPALRGGFIWDDDFYVTENPMLRTAQGLKRIWVRPGADRYQYYPLAYTGFWAQYQLYKLQPFGYHLVNILLHAANVVVLWWVLRRLNVAGAWWAAAIFAVHPVMVESVAWITEFKNVSSGLFSLFALLTFLRFRATRKWRLYALATFLFVCALLSKTAVCCLPVVIVVLIWWKKGRVDKGDILELAPWFLASLILGLITMKVESNLLEPHRSGFPIAILAGRALWFYASKVFWPQRLTFVYPQWHFHANAAWQYVFPVAAAGVIVALWLLRRRIGRGPLVGVLCFTIMLLPVLGFSMIYYFRYSYVADHFQYLACIGLIVSMVSVVYERTPKHIRGLIGVIVLLVLGLMTRSQAGIYRDLETLWRDTLAKNPNAWMAHFNLGNVLQEKHRLEQAIEEYHQGLRLRPLDAEAHNNLGTALMKSGKTKEAIAQYKEALRINPDYAEPYNNLGVILEQAGNTEEAAKQYEQAVRLNPDYAEAQYNLGNSLLRDGHLEDAIRHYQQAVRIKPDYPQLYNALGKALFQSGKPKEAIKYWEQALRIKPDYAEAHNNLGGALAQVGRLDDAVGQYEEALKLEPDYAEAHYNLGVVLLQQGKVPAAIGHWERALQINPDYSEAHYNLGLAAAQAGRPEEAMRHWQEAVRIRPDYVEAHYNLGVALEQTGKREEAIQQYERALQIKPDYTDARNRLARLRPIEERRQETP